MRFLLATITTAGLLVSGAAAVEHTADSLETVKKSIDEGKALLVDVREPAEWKAGHIAGAVFVPLSKLKKDASQPEFADQLAKDLPKEKIVYCHCRSGNRVLPASEILKKIGYDVRPLKAGYSDLLKAGFLQASNAGSGAP